MQSNRISIKQLEGSRCCCDPAVTNAQAQGSKVLFIKVKTSKGNVQRWSNEV
jgi:hypothetical protein